MPPSSENDPLVVGGTSTKNGGNTAYKAKSNFNDHFSLEAPSDQVRFRKCAVRVFSSGTQQFQIVHEEENDSPTGEESLKAKVTSDGSSGLSFLRACYTLVSVLMMGFLLIFCIQVLLFLFVSLAQKGGLTSKQNLNWFALMGSILSIPIFVYGLASALTMATEFVLDTWQGNQFFRSVLKVSVVAIDWFYFLFYLGIPFTVMITQMFTNDHWWEVTALTWFKCITFTFCIFCLVVFIIEIWGALELLAHHPDYALTDMHIKNVGVLLKRAILLRQLHGYSGVRHRTFLIEGTKAYPSSNVSYEQSELADTEHVKTSISLYTRFTQWLPDRWFYEYDHIKRQFNIEDVLDRTVFVTDSTWNLEKLFCRRQEARSVLVVNGPSRITPAQTISSFACSIVGNLFIILLVAAVLKWGGLSVGAVIFLTLVFIGCNYEAYYRIYVMWDTYRDTLKRREATNTEISDEAESEAIYQVTETYRVTRPSELICWILFGLEIGGLFVFPFAMLCSVGNQPIAILFAILGFFSGCRHYFNAPVVLSELGSLDLLDGQFIQGRRSSYDVVDTRSPMEIAEEDWREKNRLSKIVGRISQGGRRDTWVGVIGMFVFIFLFLFLSAFHGGSNTGNESSANNLLHDFKYVPKDNTFKYPTCAMTADFQIPGTSSHAMADYAYMAGIAYSSPDSMPELLEEWFGEGVAVDNVELVEKFRKKAGASAVHYKLITFPANPEFAVVTIRGTMNGWDMISDAQLWSASALAQYVRALLPVGEMWNPILEELVEMIAILQTASLREVAFYVQTTNFVNWLHSEGLYEHLRITGHSLGVSSPHDLLPNHAPMKQQIFETNRNVSFSSFSF